MPRPELLSIYFIGSKGVGKSNLIRALSHGDFSDASVDSFDMKFFSIKRRYKDHIFKTQYIEYPSNEEFLPAHAFLYLILFDLSKISVEQEAQDLLKSELCLDTKISSKLVLVGTKFDLLDEVEVYQQYPFPIALTSAKDGFGLDALMAIIEERYYEHAEKREEFSLK